ncbi:hypothetical protein ACMDCR_15540 [Labrys okinawensis]|uniref:hypothetical protein n=1 Tax=Labrys okinawensis TaxID=346911 RepID=UPI0039BC9A6C
MKISHIEDRHSFLNDLAVDAELTSSVLREPAVGRNAIGLVVNTYRAAARSLSVADGGWHLRVAFVAEYLEPFI